MKKEGMLRNREDIGRCTDKCSKNKMQKERMIRNMEDAGCGEDLIQRFLHCYHTGDIKGGLRILSSHRQVLLDAIHKEEKEIDCLDYLVWQIEKEQKMAESI